MVISGSISIPALGEVSNYWGAGASRKLGREGGDGVVGAVEVVLRTEAGEWDGSGVLEL